VDADERARPRHHRAVGQPHLRGWSGGSRAVFRALAWQTPMARKVLGWPKQCKLARAFMWEYSYKRLELAQLLGQLGVLLTNLLAGERRPKLHAHREERVAERRVLAHQPAVGRGRVSLLANSVTWHSKLIRDIGHLCMIVLADQMHRT
jgi:hypothetical protein